MKKVLSAVLAMSIAISLMALSASAASPDTSALSVDQLANMDVYSASPETQMAILNARAKLVFGDQAWTVNGAISVFDTETGTEEVLPEFSDVFPGWNLSEIEAAATNNPAILASVLRLTAAGKDFSYNPPSVSNIARAGSMIDYSVSAYLPMASDITASPSFTDVVGNGNVIGVAATADPYNGSRYNLGVSCGQTHVGWKPSLQVGQGIKFTADAGRSYAIRGSAYRTEFTGWYEVRVTEDPNFFEGFVKVP